MMEYSLILARLFLTFILAFIFGVERQKSHKPVGFGTFIFVSGGSCVLSLVALNISDNPLLLIGPVITGIGFLGAGALIRNHDKTFGFTTAAAIWAFAIIGISIGLGEYLPGLVLYSFVWVVVVFDRYMEIKGLGSYRSKLTINTNRNVDEKEIREFLKGIGVKRTKLISLSIEQIPKKNSFIYFIEGDLEKVKEIPEKALKNKWINSFKIE